MHSLVGMIIFWLLLGVVALSAAMVLVWLVNRRRRARGAPLAGVSAVFFVSLAALGVLYFGPPLAFHFLPKLIYRADSQEQTPVTTRLTYTDIKPIIVAHCVSCHSRNPTDLNFPIAPMGLRIDTYADLKDSAPRVFPLTVTSEIMPLYNMTGMTAEERAKLGEWIDGGAPQ